MKTSILWIVGLCVLSAQAVPEPGVQTVIDAATQYLNAEFMIWQGQVEKAYVRLTNYKDGLAANVAAFKNETTKNLLDKKDLLENSLQEISLQGNESAQCAESAAVQLKELTDKTHQALKNVWTNADSKVQLLMGNLGQEYQTAAKQAAEEKHLLQECGNTGNVVIQLDCIKRQVSSANNFLPHVVGSLLKKIASAAPVTLEIASDSIDKLGNITDDSSEKGAVILREAFDCARSIAN